MFGRLFRRCRGTKGRSPLLLERLEPRILLDAKPSSLMGLAAMPADTHGPDIWAPGGLSLSYSDDATPGLSAGSIAAKISGGSGDGPTPLGVTLAIDKNVSGTSAPHTSGTQVAIGEVVTFDLVVTVDEGVTGSVIVTDDIPSGMRYVDGSLSVTPNPDGFISTGYVNEASSSTLVGGVLTVDLGTVVNSFVNPGDDNVTLTLKAVVVNTGSNQQGVVKLNRATVTDGVLSDSATASVSVVEPSLEVTKDVIGDSTNLAPGSDVQYRIELFHASGSGASAFDLEITDALPVGIQDASIGEAYLEGPAGRTDLTGNFRIGPGSRLETVGNIDLPLGGGRRITIVLNGTVGEGLGPDGILSNRADLTWTSLNGNNGAERTGTGGVNDYMDSDTASLTIHDTPPDTPPDHPDIVLDPPSQGILEAPVREIDYRIPPLDVAPLYSGSAPPGTTLTLAITANNGELLGRDSVVADAGGNWLISFPAVYLQDYPYEIEVRHESSFFGGSGLGQTALLRLHYSPAMNILSVFRQRDTLDNAAAAAAGQSLTSLHKLFSEPLNLVMEIADSPRH